MQVIKKILLFLAFCSHATFAFEQVQKDNVENDQYRAIHWTRAADGLPQDGLNAMFEDAKGFLWIGSDGGGLCRFDGTNFKRYHTHKERGAINSNEIFSF